jgi:hypothetical protein
VSPDELAAAYAEAVAPDELADEQWDREQSLAND